MFKLRIARSIFIGFFLVLPFVAWLAIYAYNSTRQLTANSHNVAHSHNVPDHTERLLAIATNSETPQRDNTLAGNKKFPEPYTNGNVDIRRHYTLLMELTKAENDKYSYVVKHKSDIDSFLRNQHDFYWRFFSLLSIIAATMIVVSVNMSDNHNPKNDSHQLSDNSFSELSNLDNTICGYHTIDATGMFVEINNTLLRWLGYKGKDEVLGKLKFADIISPADSKSFQDIYTQMDNSECEKEIQLELIKKDGGTFPVIIGVKSITDKNGHIVKSRFTTFNITRFKLVENQKRELQQELDAFAYSISHDLRAPLRSIDGYSRVLQEDFGDKLNEEGKRVINVIMNNTQRMGQLINDLLDFARVGRKDVIPTTIDMNTMVNGVVTELTQQLDRKIDVVVHPLATAEADTEMIRQVWINLISNAIKYTGKISEPKIEISSYNTGQDVCYQVKDNGVGFDMQYADKLFGVFQRLHKMQDFNGTGVGLAIVKRILSKHHGRVWAEAKVNAGAIFYFTIPQVNGKQ